MQKSEACCPECETGEHVVERTVRFCKKCGRYELTPALLAELRHEREAMSDEIPDPCTVGGI